MMLKKQYANLALISAASAIACCFPLAAASAGSDSHFTTFSTRPGSITYVSMSGLPCGSNSLTQSDEPKEIVAFNTLQCAAGPTGPVRENGFARSFTLAEDIDVCGVQFGIDFNDEVGAWPIEVRLLEEDIDGPYRSLELRGSSTVMIPPDTEHEFFVADFDPPVQFLSGEDMVVELHLADRHPDEGGDGGRLWIASNDLGESAPSYVRSPQCGEDDFVPFASIGFPNVHATMTVFANEPAVPTPTLSLNIAPGSHPAQPGDEVIIRVRMTGLGQWQAAGFQAFLEYDPDQLTFKTGLYTSQPFGLPIISPIQSVDTTINLAAGIDTFAGQEPTSDDADLVVFIFTVHQGGCVTSLQFRQHDPPTRLTDPSGVEIQPLELISLPAEQPSADLNDDGTVDIDDLFILLGAWGPCPVGTDCPEDLNCDGVVDIDDLFILLANWS